MDSIQIVFSFVVNSLVVMFALTTLFFFKKKPIYVIGLIFALYLLGCLLIGSRVLSITAAGISIYLMDLVALLLLFLSAPFSLHLFFSGLVRNDSLFVILMVFTLCLSLSYILGMKQFGVQGATNVSPHSFYVQSLLRCGAVGLIAFVSLDFRLIQQSFKWSLVYLQRGELMRFTLVLIVVKIFYSLVFGANYTHSILFGTGIEWCRIRQTVHLEEAGN
jgi:hypothetical protein